MAYASVQDLVDAYGEDELVRASTADGAEFGAVDAVRTQRRLEEASDWMDSYLRRRYVTPLAVVGAQLRRCCCDLARKLLLESGPTNPSDQVIAAAKRAQDWLRDIADGRVTLDGVELAGPLSGARVQDRARPMPGVDAWSGPYRGW